MGKSMHQFVGSYNARKMDEEKKRREIFQSRTNARKALKARQDEIAGLICKVFWQVEKHNKRSTATMAKAYETGEMLAKLGGEDYQDAVTLLRFAFTGPEAYEEACLAMRVEVNDH